MKHDILKLEISVDYKDVHHVTKSSDELVHYFLYDLGRQLPILEFHQLFEIVSVTELHKDVEARVSFNRLFHFGHV